MNEPWILADFAQAVGQFESALSVPATNDLIKAGSIQYFEFCFELAWKSIKMVSSDLALPDCLSPKACLKQAFAQGWIDTEEVWLAMLEARNRMSHTYDAKEALKIYDELSIFKSELSRLLTNLKTEISQG